MKLLFAGTPAVALPALAALLASEHEVVAALTRPDAPARRGRRLRPSPVRVAAEAAGLPVITSRPGDRETLAHIRELGAEAAAVVAYGHILRAEELAALPIGWVNLHFSLLPAWRGAAPVQRALMAGATRTGVSVFRIDAGMDTGPVYATRELDIEHGETAGALLDRLAAVGAPMLVGVFDQLAAGTAAARPQLGEATLAPKVTVAEARVDWRLPAEQIMSLIRGVTPEPGAWTELHAAGGAGERLGLGPVAATAKEAAAAANPVDVANPVRLARETGGNARLSHTTVTGVRVAPGELSVSKRAVLVGTGTEPVELGWVQPVGKRPMPAADWARGARLPAGARLD